MIDRLDNLSRNIHAHPDKYRRRLNLLWSLPALAGTGVLAVIIAQAIDQYHQYHAWHQPESQPPHPDNLQVNDTNTYVIDASNMADFEFNILWNDLLAQKPSAPFAFLIMDQAAVDRYQQDVIAQIYPAYADLGVSEGNHNFWTLRVSSFPDDFPYQSTDTQARYLNLLSINLSAQIYASYEAYHQLTDNPNAQPDLRQLTRDYTQQIQNDSLPQLIRVLPAFPQP